MRDGSNESIARNLFVDDGPERPVPAPGVGGEGRASGDGVVPGVEDLGELDPGEAGLGEAMLDLEGLPELLMEPLELEPAEGELVEVVLALEHGVPLGLLGGQSTVEGLVVEQHRMIMNRIHRRQDAEEDAARPEAGADGREGPV